MKIIKELAKNIKIGDIKQIYNNGNKLAVLNSYDICIGFIDDVNLGGTSVNLEGRDIECLEGFRICEHHEIDCKKDSLIKFDSVYYSDEEECYLARIYPFTGEYKDCWLCVYLYEKDILLYENVYEVED